MVKVRGGTVRSRGLAKGTAGESEFIELFSRFYSPVVDFFYRRLGSREEARELAQDTFLRVYLGLDRFEKRNADIASWVFTIALNLLRNRLRDSSRSKRRPEDLTLDSVVEAGDGTFMGQTILGTRKRDPLEEASDAELHRLLYRQILQLPPKMRRCLLLHLDDDLRYREIAEVLGVSINTVKAQLHQARERLKDSLGPLFREGIVKSDNS